MFTPVFMQTSLQFLKDYGPIISLITFALGLLLGNWMAIGRDKRKEFNEVAEPMAEALMQVRGFPCIDNTLDFFKFRRVLNRWELFWFDKYLEGYEEAKKNAKIYPPENNEFFAVIGSGRYHDPAQIIKSIDKLLKFTTRK